MCISDWSSVVGASDLVWRDGGGSPDGARPNNWVASFGGKAWTWDDATEQWYLHNFLPEQPDLNWGHPDVEQAQHDVLRFWPARGIDGFRADVVHLIGQDPSLPDLHSDLAEIRPVPVKHHTRPHRTTR